MIALTDALPPTPPMDIVIPYHVFQGFLALQMLAILMLLSIALYHNHSGFKGDPKRKL
jgi:hypothetical protein